MHLRPIAAAAALMATAAFAAEPVQVIITTITGHPTAVVPGAPTRTFKNFWRPYGSPDGKRWAMKANSEFFSSGEMLVVGQGLTATSPILYQMPMPVGGQPGEFITNVDEQVGIRNDGSFVTGVNTSFGSGPEPSPDEYILFWDGAAWNVALRETDPVPGFPGSIHGAICSEAHILNDGRIAYNTISSPSFPTDSNTMMLLGNTIVAREGVTVPVGQALGGTQPWDFFDFNAYWHSADGSKYVIAGDLRGSTNGDNVVVVNNQVVIQEGQLMFPFVSPVAVSPSGLGRVFMASTGDWFFRGLNSDGRDWVVRNGAVIAATDSPITPGATELFDDPIPATLCFFMQAGDNTGNFVVGGVTNNPNTQQNAVVVRNGQTVVVRKGDPVDLNNNCQNDDDAFLEVFADDQTFLANGTTVYFNANIRNGAGTVLGKGYMRKCLSTVVGDLDCDGQRTAGDIAVFVDILLGMPTPCQTRNRADFNGDSQVDGRDIESFVAMGR